MSWSITLIGRPEKVVEALNEQSAKMQGQSKVEFDSVLPALITLAQQNFGTEGWLIKVTGSGHGSTMDGVQIERYCTASVERVYGVLV